MTEAVSFCGQVTGRPETAKSPDSIPKACRPLRRETWPINCRQPLRRSKIGSSRSLGNSVTHNVYYVKFKIRSPNDDV